MSHKLIIAEKPSVADAVAHAVGAAEKVLSKDGKSYCREGSGYYVAHAAGHLYDVGMPEDYGYKNWTMETLPFFPDLTVHAVDSTKEGLRNMISELMKMDDVDGIICATDAGREGELIFRHIYNANGCTKPVERLWINSVTDEAILDGMKNLKPMSDYDNMYAAAFTREKLDWLIGMNLSRLYGIMDNYPHRIGRVKTPLLNIIVQRDNEIAGFVKKTSYRLMLSNGALSENVYEDKAECEAKADESRGKTVNVQSVQKKEKEENRPELYNLAALQMDANDLLGISAAETLAIAQSLYEKKLTTYPRTDSRYISEDLKPVAEKIVKKLSEKPDYSDRAGKLLANGLNLDKRIVDNAKITDHHAIIPTENIDLNAALSDNERKVYEMIINRLLMAVDKKYRYTEITYEFFCEDITYSLVCRQPVELGWKEYRPHYEEDNEDKNVPDYEEFSSFTAEVSVKECVTQPKKHYTDKTLISVMENIDNRIDDKSLKAAVSGKGIGTSATRAGIIEELIKADYIVRKGKQILATDFGKEFIASLPDNVKSVERTAEWEQVFDDIQNKGISPDELTEDVKTFIRTTIVYEQSNNRTPLKHDNPNMPKREAIGICPRCGKNVYESRINFYCESGKGGCNFVLWKENRGIRTPITADMAKKLLDGNAVTLKAVSKEGTEYTAEYKIADTGEYINLERQKTEKVPIGKCPKCEKNVYEGRMNFYCESGRDGCGFTLWKEDKYNKLTVTAKNAKELLAKKKSVFTVNVMGNKEKITYRLEITDKYVNLKKEES